MSLGPEFANPDVQVPPHADPSALAGSAVPQYPEGQTADFSQYGLTPEDVANLDPVAIARGETPSDDRGFNRRVGRYVMDSQSRGNLGNEKAITMASAKDAARQAVESGQMQPQTREGSWLDRRERRSRILQRAASIGKLALDIVGAFADSKSGIDGGSADSFDNLDFSSWRRRRPSSPVAQTGNIAATEAGIRYDQEIARQVAGRTSAPSSRPTGTGYTGRHRR